MVDPSSMQSIYPVPNPNLSDEGYDRFNHLDLTSLPDVDLARERIVCGVAAYVVRHEWLLERELGLSEELDRRGCR